MGAKGLPNIQILAIHITVPSIKHTVHDTPNPTGIEQHSKDMRPDTIAYGNCVRTCSAWSHPVPTLDSTVVSEIGEQWSPQVAPLRTAAVTAKMISMLAPD